MNKVKTYFNNYSAMTLVEILVSIVILGLILIAMFPLLTQSLQVTNLANQITAQLFADQEDIEIVAATDGGVLFADGTFLTDKEFKVLFGSSAPFNPKTVVGMTIKKGKLVRFIASIARIKATYVYEGYTASEAEIPITGIKTSFIDTTQTVLLVTDREGNDVTTYCGYEVSNQTQAKIILPTDENRFTNALSPFTITMTTGNEQVSTLLPVYLPRSIAVDSNRDLIISSNSSDWISKDTSSIIDNPVNKIAYMATSEQDAKYVAVGNKGSIYVWLNGQPLQKVAHNLTTENLNNIIYSGDKGMLLVCGDNGIILTSNNGSSWTKQNSGTSENLKDIGYQKNSDRFICIGDRGGILTSPDGINWTPQHIYPRLSAKSIDNHDAVEFSGNGDYLKTLLAPVTGGTLRTILMVVSPQKHTANLLAWGSPQDTIAGGRFSFGIDNDGKLRVEQSGASFSSSLVNNQPSLLICRSTSDKFNSYQLSINGEIPVTSTIDTSINTSDYFPAQLGSDPLTRYSGPVNFEGLIAEVLIFDIAINASRNTYPNDTTKKYASDLDLLRKYLSDKYDLQINKLDDTDLDQLYYPGTDITLQQPLNDFPANVSRDNLVLWLDASNPESLNLGDKKQVTLWKDLSGAYNTSGIYNHAYGADLLTVACSTNLVVTGGFHRNLLNSVNTSNWNQTNKLNTSKRVTEYSLSNIVCTEIDSGDTTEVKFVALLNDGLSKCDSSSTLDNRENGLIARSNNGIDWTLLDLSVTSNHIMNDMFYSRDSGTILIVGNNGSMFTSSDKGETWDDIDTGTSRHLLAVCIR